MICPRDNQPCTYDHSRTCYESCLNQRASMRRTVIKPTPTSGFDIPYDLPRGIHPVMRAPDEE